MKRHSRASSSADPYEPHDEVSKAEPSLVGHGEEGDDSEESAPLLTGKGHYEEIAEPAKFSNGFGLHPYLRRLEANFGYELLAMLFASQHLMKGFVHSFLQPTASFLYRSYKVSGPQMQVFVGVTMLPWAMKPIIGLLSDILPVNGYNKAPYVLLVALLGTAATAAIGSMPQAQLSLSSVVLCLFLVQLQISTTDLLTEAKYAEHMQEKPKEGPALMTYVWFGLQFGGLLATIFIGPVLQHFGPKVPFLMMTVPMSIIVVPVLKGYMQEKRLSNDEIRAKRHKIFRQKEACILCVLMLASTVTLSFLGTTVQNVKLNALATLAVAFVIIISFSALLRPEIAKVNVFFVVQTFLNFSVGGASFYFYTDSAAEYPEGPHFSKLFFTTVLGVVGAIFSLLGIYSYQRFASDWSYRRLLLVSNVALSVLSFTDVVFFLRLNKKVGIPDHAFVLGSSVFTNILQQWQWMPGVVILSQLCPKGMEAMMYGLLTGCHNLGMSIASTCGAWALQVLEVQPSGGKLESAQFRNLWVASAISSLLPALTLLALPWLIPDRKQTDKLMEEGDESVTRGSLWRRLTGSDNEL